MLAFAEGKIDRVISAARSFLLLMMLMLMLMLSFMLLFSISSQAAAARRSKARAAAKCRLRPDAEHCFVVAVVIAVSCVPCVEGITQEYPCTTSSDCNYPSCVSVAADAPWEFRCVLRTQRKAALRRSVGRITLAAVLAGRRTDSLRLISIQGLYISESNRTELA